MLFENSDTIMVSIDGKYGRCKFMKIIDVNETYKDIFFRCLHLEYPADPEEIALREKWHKKHIPLGLRAKLIIDDAGDVVGLCQYLPIENSFVLGKNLFMILCIWIHGYQHGVGFQQKKGYGKKVLEYIEADALKSGSQGVAAWGMDFPYWNPVSFYEKHGYHRVDKDGDKVLVVKPFSEKFENPSLLRNSSLPEYDNGKKMITSFVNGWCSGGCSRCVKMRKVVRELGDIAEYREVDTSEYANRLKYGIDNGIYFNTDCFEPDEELWNHEYIKQSVLSFVKQT